MELYKKHGNNKEFNLFLPITVILCIIPLIVRMSLVKFDEYSQNIFGTTADSDLFSQKKAFWLIIFSVILIGLSIVFFRKVFEKKDKTIMAMLICAGVFMLFTILSAIFSKYKQEAFFGVYDRAEGLITIICYMIVFLYSLYTFKTTENYKYIVWPILVVVFINAFLGLFQYMGSDLLKTSLGSLLVIPSKYRTENSTINLLYEKGKLYGTLYHYNYVGSFVAIVIPILLGIFISEKYYIGYKLTAGLGFICSLWLLFGSTSRAGIIGLFVAFILAIIIFAKSLATKWKGILIGIVSVFVIIVAINFASKGSIFQRIPSLISDSLSVFKSSGNFNYLDNIPVKDIKNNGDNVDIVFQNETLNASFKGTRLEFTKSNGDVVKFTKDDKVYKTDDPAFPNLTLNIGKLSAESKFTDGVLLNINGQTTFILRLKTDGTIHLVDKNSQQDIDLDFPETFGFNGKEKLGSARGYIWSRAIPLLKQSVFIGGGPDSFVFRFPQRDLLGKYYAYDTPNMIVDKPHNLYLQIGLNEGIIALLAFLALIVIYFIDSIKLYAFMDSSKYSDSSYIYGVVTFLGVIGYLFAGLFNDSVISVAPVFWIVFGVSVAINYINRSNLKKLK